MGYKEKQQELNEKEGTARIARDREITVLLQQQLQKQQAMQQQMHRQNQLLLDFMQRSMEK